LETGSTGSSYPDLSNTALGTTANTGNTTYTCFVSNWINTGPQTSAIAAQANDACSQGTTNDISIVTGNPAAPATSATINAYAIYGKLVSTTNYFCIDSSGQTNPSAIAHASSTCPTAGN
jgi:hypothetical protein